MAIRHGQRPAESLPGFTGFRGFTVSGIQPSRAALLGVSLTVVLAAISGCGSDRIPAYPTRGRVVFSDGKPVKLGSVELLSPDRKITAVGTIRTDGTFVLGTYSSDDGAVVGEHQAIVTQLIIDDGLQKHELDHGDPVDPRFGNYSSSPLRVTIKELDSNEITLTVEKAKSR